MRCQIVEGGRKILQVIIHAGEITITILNTKVL